MKPIGEIIRFWRMKTGFTQAEVAERSGVSRPNLSAIEQGSRDLTIQTLRRIAAVLGVRPGVLVDGTLPSQKHLRKLGRFSFDRIGRFAAGEPVDASPLEKKLARDLAAMMSSKIQANKNARPQKTRSQKAAFLRLKMQTSPEIFRHLIRRVEKHLA